MSRKTERHQFIENLKIVITDYQAKAERLQAGTDRVYSTGKNSELDISAEEAARYRRLISHYQGVVTRYEDEKK